MTNIPDRCIGRDDDDDDDGILVGVSGNTTCRCRGSGMEMMLEEEEVAEGVSLVPSTATTFFTSPSVLWDDTVAVMVVDGAAQQQCVTGIRNK
jgi:hypothetical protein